VDERPALTVDARDHLPTFPMKSVCFETSKMRSTTHSTCTSAPAIIVALLPGSLSWQNTSTYFGPPGTAPSSARSFWLSRRTLSPKRPVSTIA
jgi:hypothetical protein